jgi:hypothetical protein
MPPCCHSREGEDLDRKAIQKVTSSECTYEMFLRHQHRGSSGQLANRMKEFGLPHDALLPKYKLLVELDWLRPAFHVPIEREWFENWANFL